MFRRAAAPLRFAHSSGALALDAAERAAIQGAFAGLGRPPVVLQATPSLEAADLEPSAIWAAEATALAGGRAIVAGAGGPIDRLKRIGAEFAELPLDNRGPVGIGRNASRLRKLIEAHDVDIVHARNREIAWAARQATRGLSGKRKVLLVTSVGADAPFREAVRDGGSLIDGDCIVAGSVHVRDVIAAADPEKRARTAIIPEGIDFGHFTAGAISSERLTRLARGWGMLEEPSPTIFAPGALEPLRGQHALARALGYLPDAVDLADVVTIIAGDAPSKSNYAEQLAGIARKSRAGRVFLSGAVTDMPAAMMLADIVVSLPMEPLGQDVTAAMAQALGKPVLAADHGASAEVPVDGKTGMIVPATDPEAVADAIVKLLRLPADQRDIMADAARTRARLLFSASSAALATTRLYAALMADAPVATVR